jgi:hypothetical protein
MLVYVINQHGKPLMPCKPAKARRLLKNGKAKVAKRTPFTIQLLYGSSGYTQDVTLGIDAGYAFIGFSAVTASMELINGDVEMLEGMSKRLEERAMYRRTRRNRLRHRRNKGIDEHKPKGWIAPSIQHKHMTHIRLVNQIKGILPISVVTIEVAAFDVHKIRNPDVEGIGYQQGDMYGFNNVREYVLHRDGHKCKNKNCKNKDKNPIRVVHHIDFDRTHNHHSNLITLCSKCHTPANHKGFLLEWKEADLKISFSGKASAYMNIVRKRMVKALDAEHTFGYITKGKRRELGLEKSHANDAFVIAGGTTQKRSIQYHVKQNRRNNRSLEKFYDATYIDLRDGKKKKGKELSSGRTKRNKELSGENLRRARGHKVKKGRRSIRKFRHEFRPYDLVRYEGKLYRVAGSQNKGAYVKLRELKKPVNAKKIQLVKYGSGLCWTRC